MAWPPDVADGQVIAASHINAIKNSVSTWPGSVDANNFALNNAGGVRCNSMLHIGTTASGFGVSGIVFDGPAVTAIAVVGNASNDDTLRLYSFRGSMEVMKWNLAQGATFIRSPSSVDLTWLPNEFLTFNLAGTQMYIWARKPDGTRMAAILNMTPM